jgi:hypothetical protein
MRTVVCGCLVANTPRVVVDAAGIAEESGVVHPEVGNHWTLPHRLRGTRTSGTATSRVASERLTNYPAPWNLRCGARQHDGPCLRGDLPLPPTCLRASTLCWGDTYAYPGKVSSLPSAIDARDVHGPSTPVYCIAQARGWGVGRSRRAGTADYLPRPGRRGLTGFWVPLPVVCGRVQGAHRPGALSSNPVLVGIREYILRPAAAATAAGGSAPT